uniref:Uncharacterized protein n=1 Tax=Plectus sambesii TaxID=2011161 RepID=A0A914X6P1_9BILA
MHWLTTVTVAVAIAQMTVSLPLPKGTIENQRSASSTNSFEHREKRIAFGIGGQSKHLLPWRLFKGGFEAISKKFGSQRPKEVKPREPLFLQSKLDHQDFDDFSRLSTGSLWGQ